MSKRPVFCSILKRLDDDHQYPADPFGVVADLKIILEKARMQTVRELFCKTLDRLEAKLLTPLTALRAYRNRHLATPMQCCDAWALVGKDFDPISFECIDFHRLCQIIASLTRVRIAEREEEIRNLPRTGLRAWRSKKPMLCLHAVTGEDGHTLENEDESDRRLCGCWGTVCQARAEGPRHHQYENILQNVEEVPDDTRWETDRNEFDELMATKKESALALMETRTAFIGVREDWVRRFCSTHTNMCWRVVLSLRFLPKVELCLFPSPPMSTTMDEL